MESKKAFGAFRTEWIALEDLRPHPRVQRIKDDKKRQEKLAKEWKPMLCRPLDVIPNGRCNYVIDGKTRLGAANLIYHDKAQTLPCHVYDTITEKYAAGLFLGFNDAKPVKVFEKWLVRRIEEDPIVSSIDSLLKMHGLQAVGTDLDGGIRAVAALEKIFSRQKGDVILDRTLRLLLQAWGTKHDAFDGLLLMGVALVVQKLGDHIEDAALARRMAKQGTPGAMIGDARVLAKVSGRSVASAMGEKIIGIWNKGRHESSYLKL